MDESTDFPGDIQRDIQSFKDPDGPTDGYMDIPMGIWTYQQTYRCTDVLADIQMCQRTIHMSAQQGKMHAQMTILIFSSDFSYLKLTFLSLKSWEI